MARGRAKAAVTKGGRAALLGNIKDETIKKVGEGRIMSAEEMQLVEGLPLKGMLPLQYLLGIDVFPLHRYTSILGEYGSMKTLFCWSILAKAFADSGGMVVFLDAEHKSNPDQILGAFNNDLALYEESVIYHKVLTLDDALAQLPAYVKKYQEFCPKGDVPMLIFLDSIGGLTSDTAVEAMEKKGLTTEDSGFGAARRAQQIAEQLRAFVPVDLPKGPFSFVAINQITEKIDGNRPGHLPPEKTSPGGKRKDYAATYNLELKKGKVKRLVSATHNEIYLTSLKSGFSETGKKVKVIVTHEGFKDESDTDRLRVTWDWNESLIDLLVNGNVSKDRLKEVLQLTAPNKQKCSSSTLGLKDVSWSEMGAAIHADENLVRELQSVLGVMRKHEFGRPKKKNSGPVQEGSEEA